MSDALLDLRMISPEEAATLLGLSVRTLADWRYTHVGPAYYLYGAKGPGSCNVRYALADIRAWLAERRVEHPAPLKPGQVELPPIRRYRKSKSTPKK